MLFKLLWIVIVAWIAYRVLLAGRDLLNIAMGREDAPLPESDRDRAPGRAAPDRETTRRESSDVEDARWVDL